MESSHKYFDPQTLAKLQGLELRARSVVEGYVAGQHRSPFHGFSVEFAEHREYAPGDDVRHVDWKVFGKTDKYYLKQYEEETNLVCYLVLDTSESMQYRGDTAALAKLEYAQCVAAALGCLVLHQQDSVGLVTFDREVRAFIRASSNPSHWKQLVEVMQQPASDQKTALGTIFHILAQRLTKRCLIVIISDLLDNVPSLLAGLKHLRHRQHDVIVLHVLDADELDFPFNRTTKFKGLEHLSDVLAEPRSLRQAYLREVEKFQHDVLQGCRQQGIDYTLLRTDRSLDIALRGFLSHRLVKHL